MTSCGSWAHTFSAHTPPGTKGREGVLGAGSSSFRLAGEGALLLAFSSHTLRAPRRTLRVSISLPASLRGETRGRKARKTSRPFQGRTREPGPDGRAGASRSWGSGSCVGGGSGEEGAETCAGANPVHTLLSNSPVEVRQTVLSEIRLGRH